MLRKIFVLLLFILAGTIGISQSMLPDRKEILSYKISQMVIYSYNLIHEKNQRKYIDTVKFDTDGNPIERRITGYDTESESKWNGEWRYTYDSLGNRLLETRNSARKKIMDYFIYVYDSSSYIKKKIWNYWVNLRLAFSRIYEMNYDLYGRLEVEVVEDGMEKPDSVFSFQYDTLNHLVKRICTSDRNFQDTINIITYLYNVDGTLAIKNTLGKNSKLKEQYTYNGNKKLIKLETADETTNYLYNNNGLLTESETTLKGKKGMKLKYTYTYYYK